jgi:hypothetical protein
MAHKVQPGLVRIIAIEIAVPATTDPAWVADEVSAHLSLNGTYAEDSAIVDWQYVHPSWVEQVVAPEGVAEGEVFILPRLAVPVML